MRFSVSYANTARVEHFHSFGEPIVSIPSEATAAARKGRPQTCSAAVKFSNEEREVLPFAAVPSLDCAGSVSCLSSMQSPAIDASPCSGAATASSSVARWQRMENEYLSNAHISERRVIILIQEAYHASLARLERAYKARRISGDDATQLRNLLKTAAAAVKTEYRRTLQRCTEREAAACDVACLATKAVNCLASVYPWSSAGFVLSFAENRLFQFVMDTPPTSSDISHAVMAALPYGTSFAKTPLPSPKSTDVLGVGAARDAFSSGRALNSPAKVNENIAPTAAPLKPPRALQRLPPKKQTFERVKVDEHNVATREAVTPQPRLLHRPQVPGSPVPGATAGAAHACTFVSMCASSNAVHASAPTAVFPSAEANAGPVRPEERRYLERNQLTSGGAAFCVRSLASMAFIGYRRSNIALWQARRRMRASLTAARALVDSHSTSLGDSFFSSTGDDATCPSARSTSLTSESSASCQRRCVMERTALVS